MRPTSVTVGSVTTSPTLPVNSRQKPFSIGIGCVLSAGASLTYSVQHTFDDIWDSAVTPTWFNHEMIVNKTANDDGNYAFPVRAIRLNVTAWTSGNVTMTLIQGE